VTPSSEAVLGTNVWKRIVVRHGDSRNPQTEGNESTMCEHSIDPLVIHSKDSSKQNGYQRHLSASEAERELLRAWGIQYNASEIYSFGTLVEMGRTTSAR
jgi:hypothetical protein